MAGFHLYSMMRGILLSALVAFLSISMASCSKEDNNQADTTVSETYSHEQPPQNIVSTTQNGARRIKVNNIGPLYQVFNDSNHLQLEAARRLGISPVSDLSSAYFTGRPIVKVSSNEYYQIDSLTHSVPFLVPEAADLLTQIGSNFNDSLHARGGKGNRIKITSLLRTPESVNRLRRVNINATDSSTHQFGTTFDISYVNFYCPDPTLQVDQGDLKNLLAEVLNDLRKQGQCLVKYERKTGCFHVTATK